jgi:hypothetical protein
MKPLTLQVLAIPHETVAGDQRAPHARGACCIDELKTSVTAELASCFGPVEGSDHDSQTPNDSPEGSHSPNSFRTKQLSKILEKLRATDDGEGEAAAAPAVNLVRRRRPDGHPEKLSNSVLARAGVL